MYYYFPMGFPDFWARMALKLGVGRMIMKRDTCSTTDKYVPTDSYIQTTIWGRSGEAVGNGAGLLPELSLWVSA